MDGVSWPFTGLRERARDWLGLILENRSDRGPDPDCATDADDLRDLIRRTARQTTVEIQGGYHEGGNGVSKWIMPILVTLTTAFILGGITLTVVVSALKQEVSDLKTEVNKVEKIVEPRYRGPE